QRRFDVNRLHMAPGRGVDVGDRHLVECRSRARLARRPRDHRVRRLRMPILTAGVPCDQSSRTTAWREHAVPVPALSLTSIHRQAFAAAAAAEAAAVQGRFWDMHELLFHRQKALEDADLLGYAVRLGLDVAAFDRDRASGAVAGRIRRDVDSGLASGQVLGTPTLFIDGVVHRGGYDPPALLAALASYGAAGGPPAGSKAAENR